MVLRETTFGAKLLAACVAGAAASVPFFLLFLLLSLFGADAGARGVMWSEAAAVIAFTHALLIGLPAAMLVEHRYGLTGVRTVVGSLPVSAPPTLVSLFVIGGVSWSTAVFSVGVWLIGVLPMALPHGALGGWVFWTALKRLTVGQVETKSA